MDLSIQPYLEMLDGVCHVPDERSGEDDCCALLRDCLAANYGRLQRRLLRYLGCPDLAGDCLHEAWLRLGDMTPPATVQSPEAYVYRVACNIAMDCLRSNRARQYAGNADAELDAIADPAPGPDLIAELRSDVAAVDRALQHLPRRHQAVLMALRIDELSRHEVAAFHGLSLRRVDTMLRQALDYCAEKTGQLATVGVRSPRRALPQARLNSPVTGDLF
jgi:RNA polymerase sigma factor (sigma-70 family)